MLCDYWSWTLLDKLTHFFVLFSNVRLQKPIVSSCQVDRWSSVAAARREFSYRDIRTGCQDSSPFGRYIFHVYPQNRTTYSRALSNNYPSHTQPCLDNFWIYYSALASSSPSDMLRPLSARSERDWAAAIWRSDNAHTSCLVALHTTAQPLSTLRGWSIYASNKCKTAQAATLITRYIAISPKPLRRFLWNWAWWRIWAFHTLLTA